MTTCLYSALPGYPLPQQRKKHAPTDGDIYIYIYILCVRMHLEAELPTPQETPTQCTRATHDWMSSTHPHLHSGPAPTCTPLHGSEVWDPSLVHSSSAARCGRTWDLDPVNFFLRDFCFLDLFFGDRSLRTGPPPSPTTDLGLFIRLSMFELRETGDWDIFLGPPERARSETGGADQWVLKRREC